MSGPTILLALVIGAPAAASLLAATAGRRWAGGVLLGRLGTAAAGVGLLAGLALAVVAFSPGAALVQVAVPDGPAGPAPLALMLDRTGAVLLLLVSAVSVVAQSFAGRYLHGDARARWFTASAGLLTAASAALMCAATLITFAVCWTVAGVALWLLLGTYRELPAAREGLRRTAGAFVVGDGALWLAVTIATTRWGVVRLDGLDASPFEGSPALIGVVGTLLVVAALSRSAQLPFRGWLPATLAAPTPVSALLHAGVVNAGGVLLIRLEPLVRPAPAAVALTIVAATATIAVAAIVMIVKPDIKGALVHSTAGQMGFMILACGLGLYAAALFHLLAHGMYKAGLFLASGSQTRHVLQGSAAPPAPSLSRARRMVVTAVAVGTPAGVLVASRPLLSGGPDAASAQALLLFAWASAALALHAWLRRARGMASMLTVTGLVCAALVGYVGLVHGVTVALAPALPAVDPVTGAPWILFGVGVGLAALSLLLRATPGGALRSLQHGLYVRALTASRIDAALVRPRPARVSLPRPVVRPPLTLAPEGAPS